jgi:hypothetical protein
MLASTSRIGESSAEKGSRSIGTIQSPWAAGHPQLDASRVGREPGAVQDEAHASGYDADRSAHRSFELAIADAEHHLAGLEWIASRSRHDAARRSRSVRDVVSQVGALWRRDKRAHRERESVARHARLARETRACRAETDALDERLRRYAEDSACRRIWCRRLGRPP